MTSIFEQTKQDYKRGIEETRALIYYQREQEQIQKETKRKEEEEKNRKLYEWHRNREREELQLAISKDALGTWMKEIKYKLENDMEFQEQMRDELRRTGNSYFEFISKPDNLFVGIFKEFTRIGFHSPHYQTRCLLGDIDENLFIRQINAQSSRKFELKVEQGLFVNCIFKVVTKFGWMTRGDYEGSCLWIYIYDPSTTNDPNSFMGGCLIC